MDKNVATGFDFLTDQGLNLIAVFDCTDLPDTVREPMIKADVPLTDYVRLVLLGHAGRRFWQTLTDFGMESTETGHPVDYFSLTMTTQFMEQFLTDADSLMLYPQQNYLIPLQRLGTHAMQQAVLQILHTTPVNQFLKLSSLFQVANQPQPITTFNQPTTAMLRQVAG